MDWFLNDMNLRHESGKRKISVLELSDQQIYFHLDWRTSYWGIVSALSEQIWT